MEIIQSQRSLTVVARMAKLNDHAESTQSYAKKMKYSVFSFQKRDMIFKEEDLEPFTPICLHRKNVTLKTKEQALTVIDTTLLKCYLLVGNYDITI